MNSIKDIYRYGYGPSSSHTIAPARAATFFKKEHPDVDFVKVTLDGSLSLTGKGHRTDEIIIESFKPIETEVIFLNEYESSLMIIYGYKDKELVDTWHCISTGGGSLKIVEFDTLDDADFYDEHYLSDIKKVLNSKNQTLIEYVYDHETNLDEYFNETINHMIETVENGLKPDGLICKELNYFSIAHKLNAEALNNHDDELKIISYSYAAAEENAKGHKVTTAPTLGSSGVIPSLVYYYLKDKHKDLKTVREALIVAGVFGNIIKYNASISGAVGGCQAEIGTACAMASALVSYIEGEDLKTIEYAAEIGVEHFLGLTCDPIKGYVLIPCVERNAVAVNRALSAYKLAKNVLKFRNNAVSFDDIVRTMNYTGKKIVRELRETSLGGMASEVKTYE